VAGFVDEGDVNDWMANSALADVLKLRILIPSIVTENSCIYIVKQSEISDDLLKYW
jgi:hypothetical protein